MWRIVKIFEILPICCFFSLSALFLTTITINYLYGLHAIAERTSEHPLCLSYEWVKKTGTWTGSLMDGTLCGGTGCRRMTRYVYIFASYIAETREKLWWQHCCSFWVAWVGQPPDIEPVNEVLEAHSAVVSQQCTIVTTKTTDDDDGNGKDSLPMRRHSG